MAVGGVEDVFVDLVGDDENVEFFGEGGDLEELGAGEDLAGGVGGVAEDEGFGALLEGAAEFGGVEGEVGGAEGDWEPVAGAGPRAGAGGEEDRMELGGGGPGGKYYRMEVSLP